MKYRLPFFPESSGRFLSVHGKETFQITVSSVYETSPNSFQSYEIAALPYVLYKSCKYSVPDAYAFKTVSYKIVSGKLYIMCQIIQYLFSKTTLAFPKSLITTLYKEPYSYQSLLNLFLYKSTYL